MNEAIESTVPMEPPEGEASDSEVLLDAVKALRAADCGGWLKDCQTGLFRCSDGREKRQELVRLLDRLYAAAGI